MYLKSVMIQNYRKYGTKDNVVTFASNRSVDSNSVLNSTLIVGQNNAGKTSIVKALQKACGDNKERFSFSDFNYYYLRELLSIGIKEKEQIQTYISDPSAANEELLKFIWSLVPIITIRLNFFVDIENDSQDLLTNIGPLITTDIPKDGIVSCILKYETENLMSYVKNLYDIINKKGNADRKFGLFLKYLESFSDEYSVNCYLTTEEQNKTDFKIKDLLKINSVSFEKLHSPSRLTDAFNKIYNSSFAGVEEV